MTVRRAPALAVATLLTAAGLALPATTAAAAPACPPVIAKPSVTFEPSTTVAVTSTGYQTVHVSADVVANCATDNGSDLEVHVILSSHQFDGSLLFDPKDATYPSTPAHHYGVYVTDRIHAGDLRNSDAGVWTTRLFVTDTDDSVHAYDDAAGPSIKILRAAKITVKAKSKVKKGHKLTVRGKLTRANWDTGHDGGYGKQPVKLQFRTAKTGWLTVKNLHAGKTGKIKTKVKAKKDGWYRYAFVANGTTATALSAGDHVNVT